MGTQQDANDNKSILVTNFSVSGQKKASFAKYFFNEISDEAIKLQRENHCIEEEKKDLEMVNVNPGADYPNNLDLPDQ